MDTFIVSYKKVGPNDDEVLYITVSFGETMLIAEYEAGRAKLLRLHNRRRSERPTISGLEGETPMADIPDSWLEAFLFLWKAREMVLLQRKSASVVVRKVHSALQASFLGENPDKTLSVQFVPIWYHLQNLAS